MRTRQLKPGMKLDHPVVDRLGRNLVARGAELDDYMIDSLLKLGIMSVYIQEGEEEENPEQVPTSPEAEKNIERLRTEDRAKVTLSARYPVYLQQYNLRGNGCHHREHCR